MKQDRRAKHPAKESSDEMKSSEGFLPEQTLYKSSEMKLKVFIVDDSTEIRNRLKEMLKENTSIHLIGEAGDAEQAIRALDDLKPDVVILDIHMPKGEGMQVLKEIKTNDPGRIVIIFTAFPYPQYRQAYLSAGADYFFDKTKVVQEMVDLLAELTQKHFMSRSDDEK
jgi:DNA-binding NarL/FixJ family response regulator